MDLGFDINVGLLVSTPGEVADLVADSDMNVIGVLSQAARNLFLLQALRYDLKMRRRRRSTSGGRRTRRGVQKNRKGKRSTAIWWWW